MKNKKIWIVIGLMVIVVMLTGCSSSVQRHSDTILEQWQAVKTDFERTVSTIDPKANAEVELKIIELDDKGFPKKYEFVGIKDGKQFLVYDDEGVLKD